MSVSIVIVQDKRRPKKEGVYPLKLRVTFDRKCDYYPTIYDLSQEDYQKFSAPRISNELQQIRINLQKIETDAKKLADELMPFDLSYFEQQFIKDNPLFKQKKLKEKLILEESTEFDFEPYKKRFKILDEKHPNKYHISYTFVSYIKRLIEERRIGNALNYQDTYYCLKRFKGNVRFTEITVSYLNQYEHWMMDVNKCTKTTVGIKLRSLRAVFNEAIENKIIKRDLCYPFGRRKYQIRCSRRIKKSLDLEDIRRLYESKPERPEDQRAKAYWFFCYFGNGMNPKDLAYLKFKDIYGEYLHFIRAKTERETRNDPKLIRAYINEDMWTIIEKWGNKDKSSDNFLFPVIDKDADPLQQHIRVKWLCKFICDGMKRICKQLGIEKEVNNMVCRHSYATITKRSGASTEYVQEALGHTTKTTTEIYLGDYEDVVKKEFSSRLLAFKNTGKRHNTTLRVV